MVNDDVTSAQRRVLTVLKRLGAATPDELAEALAISSSAVRQHVGALRTAGLVQSEPYRQGGRGRPAERFRSTNAAEALFAVPDSMLAKDILDHVAAEDPALVAKVFSRRRDALVASITDGNNSSSPEQRVGAVVDLLDAQGYLADFQTIDEGHYRIHLHSCALWPVASTFSEACTSELELIEHVLPEATVDRTATRTDGSHTCSYDVVVSPSVDA